MRLTFHENDNCSFNIDQDFSMKKSKGYWLNNEFDLEEAICKLGQYEDLEDKKGLPLDVYIKLLEDSSIKKGLYFYVKGKLIGENKTTISKVYVIETDFLKKQINFQGFLKTFHFADYSKTWALTKEELENR